MVIKSKFIIIRKVILLKYIAYTEQRENNGSMILHGASYSAYTVL